MKIHFEIDYNTDWGQNLYVTGNLPELGAWDTDKALRMTYEPWDRWALHLNFKKKPSNISYKYFLKDENSGNVIWEWGDDRILSFEDNNPKQIYLKDYWRPHVDPNNALFSAAFTDNLMKRKKRKSRKTPESYNHVFRLYSPRIDEDHVFCIIGSHPDLGGWSQKKAILMDDSNYPIWTAQVAISEVDKDVAYKYGIYNKKEKRLVAFEAGDNRHIVYPTSFTNEHLYIKSDINFRYPFGNWRGAGVAIPVFSLRTKESAGVGEFLDLKALIDWAEKTGMKLVQILPINDTVATHRWTDSYPYAAISVFALHPLYLRMSAMGQLRDKKEMKQFLDKAKKLNENPEMDYEAVMKLKSVFYKKIYDETKDKVLNDKKFKQFFKDNEDWLVPYAAYSCLRDRFKTPKFTEWGEYSIYDPKKIAEFTSPKSEAYDDVAVHYFIQYHLHLQMQEVADYARSKGVVLKGDIPIGIYRDSVDAWVAPELYHMDKQAGAPPDAYAIAGQNWRFPTYNWERMEQNNFAWWRKRLTQMSKYFDAYRIDHILGFFRIWEIPIDSVEGLMGRFNPAIPMHRDEMVSWGLPFNYERMCKPYIREYMLYEIFGENAELVKSDFLNHKYSDFYELKPEYDTQHKVAEHFNITDEDDIETRKQKEHFMYGLFTLIGNVLFFEAEGSNATAFHPKIALHSTYSYKELDEHSKRVVNDIYIHYYYNRQESFWREMAMKKLPAIVNATKMLVCGEDLGMVPDCVPGVMQDLNILSLEIQRMPKGDGDFSHPADAPYLSVVSPSCHDMSTVRGWWEEDRGVTQRFYNSLLGHPGNAPFYCEPWLDQEILIQHLYSPAMWAIFPIQDIVGMDPDLRKEDPKSEQINVPSNPRHYWKYRFHMNIEELVEEETFNNKVRDMVSMSGRLNNF